MPEASPTSIVDRRTWLALSIVTIAAFFTYVRNFSHPAVPFWDERYYIVAAQKYLHGVYFIDLHPPLGKLLIALGEGLFGRNAETTQFLNITFWTPTWPKDFSFFGFRLFPVLLAWLTAPLLFLLFLKITRNHVIALLLSGLYVFDNALLVHLRGAMLEGPLVFFAVIVLLVFVYVVDRGRTEVLPYRADVQWRLALVMGVALGCALATKSIALVLVGFPILAVWALRGDRRRALRFAAAVFLSALIVVVTIWMIHFSLARRLNPTLQADGYYQFPTEAARTFLIGDQPVPVVAFPTMMYEAFRYARWYDASRPKLEFCKAGETASPFWMWPVGARSVAYWWDSDDEGKSWRYLYLQANPLIWWVALAGVFASVSLLIASVVAPPAVPLKNRFLLASITAIYAGYFVPFFWIQGVMFLYHYFIPLILSFVLLALVIDELRQIGAHAVTTRHKQIALAVWLGVAVAAYIFYRPLTYYDPPLTAVELQSRAILPLWNLRCVGCPHVDGLCGNR